ncbi:MAG TPA: DUF2090 domain-containing protein, partial [Devosia sp.]|nr:DUF2090 domain-containing protein [Devosia sp.]
DPDRLTALVLLGIRDKERFPVIFYRENCADMAICEDDIDPELIARARAVVASGTHLSNPQVEAATLKAVHLARRNGARTALDIDYRPTFWGLAAAGEGESRFVTSQAVTRKLQSSLSLFDLIVGTEEEFHIAGGTTDTVAALKNIRELSDATLVCKRGPMGAVAFTSAIPETLDEGESGPGFPIEVFNVLGAGDGFMSGLLKGWLNDEDWPTSLKYANACGAFAVSRHGCTPAYPSWDELQYFFENGYANPALRHDRALEQVHWSTTRAEDWPDLRVFAFDHRAQIREIAQAAGADDARIGLFKQLCLKATQMVAGDRHGYGFLCDSQLGQDALFAGAGSGLWCARPVELPGSRPLELEPELGEDLGGLMEWPLEQVVKVLCFYHPDDTAEMKHRQEATISRLFRAARRNRLEFLLEVVPSKVAPCTPEGYVSVIERFYEIGIYPDWWKLEPSRNERAWELICDTVTRNDPWCRGIVVLGLDASRQDLEESLAVAARHELIRGFAVGRTIFGPSARRWFAGEINDQAAIDAMAAAYAALCDSWDAARREARNQTLETKAKCQRSG